MWPSFAISLSTHTHTHTLRLSSDLIWGAGFGAVALGNSHGYVAVVWQCGRWEAADVLGGTWAGQDVSQAYGRRSPSNPESTFPFLGSTLRKSVSQVYSSANVLESAKCLTLFQFLGSSVKSRQNHYPWNGKKTWLLKVLTALAVGLSSFEKLLKGPLTNSCSYSSLGLDIIP